MLNGISSVKVEGPGHLRVFFSPILVRMSSCFIARAAHRQRAGSKNQSSIMESGRSHSTSKAKAIATLRLRLSTSAMARSNGYGLV